MYVAGFEELRIPMTMEAFARIGKSGLVRGLWRDHRHDRLVCCMIMLYQSLYMFDGCTSRVVALMAGIMGDYGVVDAQLWVAVLRRLRTCGQQRCVIVVQAINLL